MFMRKTFLFVATLIVAMISQMAYAEGKDVTSKLINPTAEGGLDGWSIQIDWNLANEGDPVTLWQAKHLTENATNNAGYWNWSDPNFWVQRKAGTVIGKATVYQKVAGLQNGTYVFGAYVATVRGDGNVDDPADYLGAYGGFMFANDDTLEVRTNNPAGTNTWNHVRKINVATTVIDGMMTLGFAVKDSCNLVGMGFDDATLYYFGDVTTDEALEQMRAIDVQNEIAVAQALLEKTMSADAKAELEAVVAFAQNAKTLDELDAAADTVRIAAAASKFSIAKYEELASLLVKAQEVADGEWTSNVDLALRQLKRLIEADNEIVSTGSLADDEVASCIDALTTAMGKVQIDKAYDKLDELFMFLNDEPSFGLEEHPGFGDEVGQYSLSAYEKLMGLTETMGDILEAVEAEERPAADALAYISTIDNEVAICIARPNGIYNLPFSYVLIPDPNNPENPCGYWGGNMINSDYIKGFYSPTNLQGLDDEVIRITTPVFELGKYYKKLTVNLNNMILNNFAIIDEFYVFDGEGNEIKLQNSNLSSTTVNGSYPLSGMIDRGPNVASPLFQTSGSNPYFTISFDEPVNAVQFVFENAFNDWRLQNTPAKITLTGMSEQQAVLSDLIADANNHKRYLGVDPGYCPDATDALAQAQAQAQAVLNNENSTEAQLKAAGDVLLAAMDANDAMTPLEIVEGKEYMVLAGYEKGINERGNHVSLTTFQDTILWWTEKTDPADKSERWTFEKVDGKDNYYYVKNVGNGKYLAKFVQSGEAADSAGNPIRWGNPAYVKLGDTPCEFRVESLGDLGQWGFWAYCESYGADYMCHMPGASQNAFGDNTNSSIVQWPTSAGGGSSFHIVNDVEMLPLNVLVENGYDRVLHRIGSGASQIYKLKADVPCEFADLHFYDKNKNELGFSTQVLDDGLNINFGKYVNDFFFKFDNKEGVKSIEISKSEIFKTKLQLLTEVYNSIKAKGYSVGNIIGEVASVDELEAAFAQAENLMENGGTDEEMDAAMQAMYDAEANLQLLLPEEGKTYNILSVFNSYHNQYGVEIAAYDNQNKGVVYTAPLDYENDVFAWKFIPVPGKDKHYYIQNVATNNFIGWIYSFETDIPMTKDSTYYRLDVLDKFDAQYYAGTPVGLHVGNSADANHDLHNPFRGYACGRIVLWGSVAAGSKWTIRETQKVEATNVYQLEDLIETAPAREGIYDLTGRRVIAPTTGLYIVNGEKVFIKKDEE